jgi:APA family basic amino acid/polyamine antiporter
MRINGETSSPPAGQARGPAPGGLLRVLGVGRIIGIVIGTMIGSGIFIVPATVAAAVRAPLVMLAVWIVGGLLSVFGALSLAELAAAYAETGGLYVYLREAYGPLAGFLFGWTLFLVIDSGSIATLASAFATKYLPQFLPIAPLGQKAVIAAFILLLVTVNILGVRRGALLQNILTTLKFAALAGIVIVVFLFADGDWGNLAAPASGGGRGADFVGAFGLALVAALWAYKGFETCTFNAGETRDPSRTLPVGIVAGCGLVTLLYLLANAAYLYAVPAAAMAGSDRIAADAMNAAVGPLGASIIAVIILFSILGAANGHALTGPRVYYAMARDGLFFRKMASVHPKYRTPHVSILVVGAWSVVLGMSGTFEQLLRYVVFGHWIFMGLAVAAVFVLRKKRPDLPRPYKALGYPVTPGLFVLAALFVTVNALIGTFWNSFAGLAIIALGIPAYLFWNKKRGGRRAAPGPSA